jgi:hypothetical protein
VTAVETQACPGEEPAAPPVSRWPRPPDGVVTGAAWAAATACVAVVLWRIGDGFDLTDEALYIQAVDPPRPDDAFNGLWGRWLRPLWQLLHWDVAAVRLAGLAALVAVAVVLGRSVRRLVPTAPAAVVPVTVAAATGFYVSGIRTPAYNWLAVVGAALACAACLSLLAGASARWGLLAGLGVTLAGLGKVTTGVVLAVLVAAAAARSRRPRALAWALLVPTAAAVIHVLLILPAGSTLAMVRRSSAMLAVYDPWHYTARGAVTTTLAAVLASALAALQSGGLAGVLPLAAGPPRPRRAWWFGLLCAVSLLAAAAVALVSRRWPGGVDRATDDATAGLVILLVTIGVAACVGWAQRLERAPEPGALTGCTLLVVAAIACVAGSNFSFGFQLNATAVLLAPACVLACRLLPVQAVRPTTAALLVAVTAGSLVTGGLVHGDPKYGAQLADSTTPVRLGPATVRVDAASAARLRSLVDTASAAGWRPGTPLVDLSLVPAVPMVLGADVPPVLIVTLPEFSRTAMVCQAVRGLGDRWRDAWVLVPTGKSSGYLREVGADLGRSWPGGYERVATFSDPFKQLDTVLLRPRAGAAGRPSDCL